MAHLCWVSGHGLMHLYSSERSDACQQIGTASSMEAIKPGTVWVQHFNVWGLIGPPQFIRRPVMAGKREHIVLSPRRSRQPTHVWSDCAKTC